MERKYYQFDAKSKPIGRMATVIARTLSGKGKVTYAPHIDGGDFVVVINSDEAWVTGAKKTQKMYHRFSGYPGGLTSIAFEDQLKKDSRKLVHSAVYGMLPKNKLRKPMLKRLFIYKNATHKHKDVIPVV